MKDKHNVHRIALRILHSIGVSATVGDLDLSPFINAEDGEEYSVWRVTLGTNTYVLKQAKEYETEIYTVFFEHVNGGAPRLLGICDEGENIYLLIEYIRGDDMRKCDRASLKKVLDALIALQSAHWEDKEHAAVGNSFEKSLVSRINRGKYLNDEALEEAFGAFLTAYQTVPRTLCHDDLLPFNVLVNDTGATLIDWELAGILPYPTSLARLIAHGEEDRDAFFFMTGTDKQFAIDYYYEHLICQKGITYADYRHTLDLFLLYEYCEWIMLGVKYNNTDSERYRHYLNKAKEHLKKMKEKT